MGDKLLSTMIRLRTIVNDPYFDSWGHSYSLMWASAIWSLASTVDNDFSFLPDISGMGD